MTQYLFPSTEKATWDTMSLKKIQVFGESFDISVIRQKNGIKAEIYVDGKLFKTFTGKEGKTFSVKLK